MTDPADDSKPSLADRAKESAEKSTIDLQKRWILRIVMMATTAITFVAGLALTLSGGLTPAIGIPLGQIVGGILLMIVALVLGIVWISLAFCCGHLWCCSRY